jgi:FixJ family two-component response regulator
MGLQTQPQALLVDDEVEMCRSLYRLLKSAGIPSTSYESAEDFLQDVTPELRGCLVLDLRLGGMSGLDLQDELKRRGICIPIIVISGHATVPDTIRAFHGGAFRVFEKPFDDERLLSGIQEALATQQSAGGADELHARLADLSDRQREVMDLLVQGVPVKQVAVQLQISPSTVAKHRAKVLEKTGVDSLVRLAHAAPRFDSLAIPPRQSQALRGHSLAPAE